MPPEQLSPGLVALGLVATAICAGSLFVWIMTVLRLARGAPLAIYEPRRPLPRRGTDILMVVLLLLILALIGRQIYAGFVTRAGESAMPNEPVRPGFRDDVAGQMAGAFALELLIIAAAIGCVMAVSGANGRDLGFSSSHLGYDFLLGGAAYLAGVVPITLIQWLFDRLGFSYSHPLIESLKEAPSAQLLLISGAGAIVVAPFCEEMIFRVLLQGWFESLEAARQVRKELRGNWTVIVAEAIAEPQVLAGEQSADVVQPEPPPASGTNPYQLPQSLVAKEATIEPMLVATRPAWWPIALSSLLFAMTHWGQGLAPIPLFFYAAILGYVYQRTHRLWPSLVAHSLLNAGSMLILWLSTKLPPG